MAKMIGTSLGEPAAPRGWARAGAAALACGLTALACAGKSAAPQEEAAAAGSEVASGVSATDQPWSSIARAAAGTSIASCAQPVPVRRNTRALPVIAQWQNGAVKAVYPAEAVAEGVSLLDFRR